ncbi:hypothetical protein PsYK624_090780 [Phanerochaete sordida]|uniref:Uncharacterized protein n=1 Tax=Phanerochaete sordida TaxID=48140 RepID=A0A9P3LFS0_9APHY|nr:hypothetical protein PsYK624_090780 [Phanerochaete sordida]
MMYHGQNVQTPGIIVPQRMFPLPQGQSPADLTLQPVRFFVGGRLGVHLDTARQAQVCDLNHANSTPQLALGRGRPTLRILWPGYSDWHYLNAVDIHGAHPTLAHITQRLAQLIYDFYTGMITHEGSETCWRLQNIPFDTLYLVELRQVGRGSWQPVLCTNIQISQ